MASVVCNANTRDPYMSKRPPNSRRTHNTKRNNNTIYRPQKTKPTEHKRHDVAFVDVDLFVSEEDNLAEVSKHVFNIF